MYTVSGSPEAFFTKCSHPVLGHAVPLLCSQAILLEGQCVILFAPLPQAQRFTIGVLRRRVSLLGSLGVTGSGLHQCPLLLL